jgi:Uridylate kinase
MDNKIPIVVFNMYKPGILRDACWGETSELWFAMKLHQSKHSAI